MKNQFYFHQCNVCGFKFDSESNYVPCPNCQEMSMSNIFYYQDDEYDNSEEE